MDRGTEQPSNVRTTFAPTLLDAKYYRDPDQYEREIHRIFNRSWLPVFPSSDLASARDYAIWDKLGQSVVVVRQDDGNLVAWHNVCQHRGARLVDCGGQCPTGKFKCPWHGFTYDLAGRVVHVPLRESFDEEEIKDLRVPTVRVREWGSFVWLSLSDEVPPLESYLGALTCELEGYGLEKYETVNRAEWEIDANWKTVMDGFLETWHVPFTHKNSLTGIILWRDAALTTFQPHSMMTIPYRVKNGLSTENEGDHRKTHLCHYLAFPNTILSCFPNHLQMFTAWPMGPRKTVLVGWGMMGSAPDGMTDEKWRKQQERDWQHFLTVVSEDAVVLSAAGTVYDSLGFRRNMFNSAEGRLDAFHATVNGIAADD